MITSEQFDNALRVIAEYKTQVETKNSNNILKTTYVDIQKNISINTYLILQTYFKEKFNENLDWNALKKMDLEKLEKIDCSILRHYRGFGKASEDRFKKLIASFREKHNEFSYYFFFKSSKIV